MMAEDMKEKKMATLHQQQTARTGGSALLLRPGSGKRKIAAIMAATAASSLVTIFTRTRTAFLCTQSDYSEHSCINHSYFRIVNKKHTVMLLNQVTFCRMLLLLSLY